MTLCWIVIFTPFFKREIVCRLDDLWGPRQAHACWGKGGARYKGYVCKGKLSIKRCERRERGFLIRASASYHSTVGSYHMSNSELSFKFADALI